MEIYLVGGAVRDELLEYPVHEKDWVVVGATAQELLDRGYRQVGRDFPVFLHPESSEEYALARTERKQGHGYQGFVCNSDPSVTLEEDLSRRDLTVNAIARGSNGQLVDPYGGQADLDQRLLRHVSPAFVEDPLRVLRVARFAARYEHLGFSVAPETLALMADIADSGELAFLASERVWTELERALSERSPRTFFAILQQCRALEKLLPEFSPEPLFLESLDRASIQTGDTAIRLAALLANAGPERVRECNARLKAPTRHLDLNLLCAECLPEYRAAGTSGASEILEVLNRVDAFRRPQRSEEFLQVCAAASGQQAPAERLRNALEICTAIQARDIARPGLKGPEIGRELEAARLKALETP